MRYRLNLSDLLVCLFLIETRCVTYAIKYPLITPASSIIYFMAGIAIAILIMRFRPNTTSATPESHGSSGSTIYKMIIAGALGVCFYHFTNVLIIDTPYALRCGYATHYESDVSAILIRELGNRVSTNS